MGRDASDISVSPAVNLLNPPPVPETPTFTRTFGYNSLNSSATASETGYTVLEPSISTDPDMLMSPRDGSTRDELEEELESSFAHPTRNITNNSIEPINKGRGFLFPISQIIIFSTLLATI